MKQTQIIILTLQVLKLLANEFDINEVLEPSYRYDLGPDKGRDSKSDAKPATSVWLNYNCGWHKKLDKYWRIENTIKITNSAPTTYFAVAGFYPGGYNGLQQQFNNDRNLIYSLWNDDTNNANLVKKGKGVTVSQFGGEGTGLKSMKDFNWLNDGKYKFTVIGKKKKKKGLWIVSCYIKNLNSRSSNEDSESRSVKKNGSVLIAKYSRAGVNPLVQHGFYSFIEDWNRSPGTEGYLHQRSAEFTDAVLRGKSKKNYVNSVRFSINGNGLDAFAGDRGFAQAVSGGVLMSTGGDYDGPNTNGTVFNL